MIKSLSVPMLVLLAVTLGGCITARPYEEGKVILQDDPVPEMGGLVTGRSGEITIYRKKDY